MMKGTGFNSKRRGQRQYYCQFLALVDGQVKPRTEWFNTAEEAQTRRKEADDHFLSTGKRLQIGTPQAPTAPSRGNHNDLDFLFEQFRKTAKNGEIFTAEDKSRKIGERTVDHYHCAIKLIKKYFGAFPDGKVKLDSLTPKVMGEMKTAMLEGTIQNVKKMSLSGVCSYLTCLRSFFTWVLWEYRGKVSIAANPIPSSLLQKSEVKNIAVGTPRHLEKEEIKKLLEAAKTLGQDIHLFIALCYYAGMRPNEAIESRWTFFNFETNFITLPAEVTKTKRKREIRIANTLKEILEPIRKEIKDQDHYLIHPELTFFHEKEFKKKDGKDLKGEKKTDTRWTYQTKLDKVIAQAEINGKNGQNVCAKMLRHSFATHLLQDGYKIKNIQKWMGHTTVLTTERYLTEKDETPLDF